MEIELSDVTGLPEHLKPVLATVDGKNKLDLSKLMPMEDLTGLKTALQTERANAGAYAKFGKPDDIAKRIADLEAAAAKGGKGGEEAQAKLDAMDATYKAQLSERDTRLTSLMRDNASEKLRVELAKAGFIAEAIDDIAATAMGRITFGDDGKPKVMTADGKPMIGTGSDHGATLADLAKELAASKPYAVQDNGKGGSGKPPGSGGTPEQKTVSRAVFDAMSQAERATHSKSGGKVTD
jgi:hypothetical protein